MVIFDPLASNYVRRFYRIGPASAMGSLAPPSLALSSSGSSRTTLILNLSGSEGVNYRIQASSDLILWTTVTNLLCTNATMSFQDPVPASYQRRFYRAVTP